MNPFELNPENFMRYFNDMLQEYQQQLIYGVQSGKVAYASFVLGKLKSITLVAKFFDVITPEKATELISGFHTQYDELYRSFSGGQ